MADDKSLQARVYKAFHGWLAANKSKIRAPHDMTVIYSGWDQKSIPVWHRLESRGKDVEKIFGVTPAWKTLQAVLENLQFGVNHHVEGLDPFKGFNYGTMWDFATKAQKHKLLAQREGQQVWLNLSAWYTKNATGKVWIWEGETLKDFPDLLLAEIPVLLKNKKIDAKTVAEAIKLAPKSAEAWKRYRSASEAERREGR